MKTINTVCRGFCFHSSRVFTYNQSIIFFGILKKFFGFASTIEGESTPKIPTLINYGNPEDTFEFSWGASVDRTQGNIVGVKLLLDPKQERPLYLPAGNIKRLIKTLPKSPVEIAADFMGAVYQHALKEIVKEVPTEYMTLCQKHFVLSGSFKSPLFVEEVGY